MDLDPFGSISARQVYPDLPQVPEPGQPDNELGENDIETILRGKRKRRSQKVCQPCRLRKVKCTYVL